METSSPRLLRKEEFAFHLQISTRTVDRMIEAGQIIPIKIGNQKRFPESLVEELKNPKNNSGTDAK